MLQTRIFVVSALAVLAAVIQCDVFDKYCGLGCNDEVHTVCLRRNQSCGPDPECGAEFRKVKFSEPEKKFILDIHNHLRNYVANGIERRGTGQPPASNINALTYNEELEFIAQCWVNRCRRELAHDKCRKTSTFPLVGQNLASVSTTSRNIDIVKEVRRMITGWYEEVTMFNSTDIKDIKPDGRVGHYLQLVWANTRMVGCAASTWTTVEGRTKWRHLMFACNYGPAGNILNTAVYEVGKPGAKCLAGKRHPMYRSLCVY
ncbi:unnamed protein product [Acanthoscelides obtectus]|uniref:SCP domain-containing protein n=1 Tax=Acanthoscelides obtectus TaxID=200917 RepID=A0A9P0M2F4_ACAOB|nr:unnamed protein product [Acanthoscelides obtectus]CAK1659989.1 hypothetical protein AOBTE_LOCUS21792 [Acanthoscelides obtectus]